MNLAFISYSHHDIKIAEWLQLRLEHFRLPENIKNPVNPDSEYLRPIFRDRTDLSGGVLSEVINKNLDNSRFLILICSRRAAKSIWVSHEAQYFVEHGRLHDIIPFVVDGIPYSGGPRECMPKFLCDYVVDHPDAELLCIDRVADGEERAFMQIVARMLDVPFDVLYSRHQRRKNRLWAIGSVVTLLIVGAAAYLIMPVSMSIQLYDQVSHLPHHEGTLTVDGQTYTVPDSCYNMEIPLQELPGFRRGGSVEVTFTADFYDTVHVTLPLGFGLSKLLEIDLLRNGEYANFAGHVQDEDGNPVQGAAVDIAGYEAETDKEGNFHLCLPPKAQQESQPIYITKEGYLELSREDEPPSLELKYILHKDN